MDKTTVILGGVYGVIVLIMISVFVLEPMKMDGTGQFQIFSNNLEKFNLGPKLSLADLFAKSDDGVVQVVVRKTGDNATDRSIGSGIVYDSFGNIITNNHVVENYQKIRVIFHDGKSYDARVVGTDPFADLAVIKVDSAFQELHPLQLGDSSKLRIGDQVVAIGSPFGLTGSMTSGIISQVGRLLNPPNISFSIPNVIQTDTAINPGNSGGPLLDMNGDVIGINTAIQSDTGEFSGIGFSIPSNTMKKIVPVLIRDGHYKHPWLGVSGVSVDPDFAGLIGLGVKRGFLIQNVVPDSPASKAGLQGYKETKTIDGIQYKIGGDIIVGIDSIEVNKLEDMLNYLQDSKSVGDRINLKIIRDGKPTTSDLVLQERPNQAQ
ncbi:MAG: trypsin-like peptidase domain-containing protein [Nitrososphaera sp.]